MPLNVKSNNILDRLNMLDATGEFERYPNAMLRKTSIVKVNPDDFLIEDEFIIASPFCNLPKEIYLYGKNTRDSYEDNIYFNYWMEVFLNTIEKGYLYHDKFDKSLSKYELTIGLPYEFRRSAYRSFWSRKNVIDFLSCLFNIKLEEVNYKQEDLLDLIAA